MGLFRAIGGAVGGQLADQWREFFYCDAMDAYTLAAKGLKRSSSKGRSSNVGGESNIISNGSIVAVNDGQCMLIVDQGRVAEVCAIPGEFIYDASAEPSVFYGGLGEGLGKSFSTMGKRIGLGGDTGRDQRVYFFNTKEILDNRYGTISPVPFRVIDKNIGLDIDIAVKCNGSYSYRIIDPLLFYTNVCGNFEEFYKRGLLDTQLKAELLTALQPAFARLSEDGIRYSSVPAHTTKLASVLNGELSAKWREFRGIEIVSFGVSAISASEEDAQLIKDLQKAAVMRDPTMAAATMVTAQADAMRTAAVNEGGAMMGFMGLGMAQQAGGANVQNLYALGQQTASQTPSPSSGGWACPCGATGNQGRFCAECGAARAETKDWTCSCGVVNHGKFCPECGAPKPTGT
ncbi:MAG: SPFH domain-containing protein [Coriobacteriales bacterium]|jgi:membrane protease subunit (stomatin/prohibitin family)|nr:SPFH domain-containing protein [Coriobacteriales bacterium]